MELDNRRFELTMNGNINVGCAKGDFTEVSYFETLPPALAVFGQVNHIFIDPTLVNSWQLPVFLQEILVKDLLDNEVILSASYLTEGLIDNVPAGVYLRMQAAKISPLEWQQNTGIDLAVLPRFGPMEDFLQMATTRSLRTLGYNFFLSNIQEKKKYYRHYKQVLPEPNDTAQANLISPAPVITRVSVGLIRQLQELGFHAIIPKLHQEARQGAFICKTGVSFNGLAGSGKDKVSFALKFDTVDDTLVLWNFSARLERRIGNATKWVEDIFPVYGFGEKTTRWQAYQQLSKLFVARHGQHIPPANPHKGHRAT